MTKNFTEHNHIIDEMLLFQKENLADLGDPILEKKLGYLEKTREGYRLELEKLSNSSLLSGGVNCPTFDILVEKRVISCGTPSTKFEFEKLAH